MCARNESCARYEKDIESKILKQHDKRIKISQKCQRYRPLFESGIFETVLISPSYLPLLRNI